MREIISLQVGRCGNLIGNEFWEVVSDEHSIDPTGSYQGSTDLKLEKVDVFYNETHQGHFVPRALMMDLEPGPLDTIRGSSLGQLYRPQNYISGKTGSGNNWAVGHYTDGAELMNEILDALRREVEACDHLQGFQVVHALGGGTGSGMGALLLQQLRVEYCNKFVETFSVFPSTKVSDSVVEPYNSVLTMMALIENTDMTIVLDNESLHNLCTKTQDILQPTYGDMNHIVSQLMSGVTCGTRFPGQLNTSLRKLATNLILFPRIHFLTTSVAPLSSRRKGSPRNMEVPQIVEQFADLNNSVCSVSRGQYLTMAGVFRGQVSSGEVEYQMSLIQKKNPSNFVPWLPDNVGIGICHVPQSGLPVSAALLANHTGIVQVFRRISEQFKPMLQRKAYMHWYTGQGMDEMEFIEAESNLRDLQSDYEIRQADVYDGEGEGFDYE